jgi:hypothetical protein
VVFSICFIEPDGRVCVVIFLSCSCIYKYIVLLGINELYVFHIMHYEKLILSHKSSLLVSVKTEKQITCTKSATHTQLTN